MYKRTFTLLALTITLGFLFSFPLSGKSFVAAVDVLSGPCGDAKAATSSTCKDNSTSATSNPIYGPNGILTDATQIIAWVVGVVSVAIILISSIRMINSGGDSNTVSSARSAILYALIGVAIAVAAQVIVVFILGKV